MLRQTHWVKELTGVHVNREIVPLATKLAQNPDAKEYDPDFRYNSWAQHLKKLPLV